MKQMQVVVPMSGIGARFQRAGYTDPKPLIDVDGRPILAHLLDRFPRTWRFVFVCNEDHLATTAMRQVLLDLVPDATIVPIAPHKLGPVHAVLHAADVIADDLPTIVNYCDFSFEWDPEHFAHTMHDADCDGAVVCYRGFQPHYLRTTKFATVREVRGRVLDIREKGSFTDDRTQEYTSSGTYFFRDGATVKRIFRKQVAEDISLNGEFYASLAYKPLLAEGGDVRVYEIDRFCQWGTPEDLQDWQYWQRSFAAWKRQEKAGPVAYEAQLLIPMAGLGSRFAAEGLPPKPLIPVMGAPMFDNAAGMVPASKQSPVYIARVEFSAEIEAAAPDATVIALDAPTDGQAVTTGMGEPALDPERPVLVSACDHGLVWDPAAWQALMAEEPDVVIVGQRDYPGAERKPHHFAYLRVAEGSDRITGVSVKQPISDTPQKDLVLVGTFWFKRAGEMFDRIRQLVAADIRVNGELYLDSVVNLCVEAGLDVRCFESDGYMGWGTPDELRVFRYWYRHHRGHEA